LKSINSLVRLQSSGDLLQSTADLLLPVVEVSSWLYRCPVDISCTTDYVSTCSFRWDGRHHYV